jgi:hypothetical protein
MDTGMASGVLPVALDHRAWEGCRDFSFADVNPLTGVAFMRSRFEDLPYLVGLVVHRLCLSDREWDRLVGAGGVAEEIDCFRQRQIPFTLACSVPDQSGDPPEGLCGDCWGTGVLADSDGSMSGIIGCAIVCLCVRLSDTHYRAPVGHIIF